MTEHGAPGDLPRTWPPQVKQLVGQISSPIDLLRTGGEFAVTTDGSTEDYFTQSLDPVAAALLPRCAGGVRHLYPRFPLSSAEQKRSCSAASNKTWPGGDAPSRQKALRIAMA